MIQLDEGPVPRLGELKIDDYSRNHTGGGIEHVRHGDVPDGGEEVVEGEADCLRFSTQTRDRDFTGNAGGGADDRAKCPPCQLQGDTDSPAMPKSE